VFGSIGCQFVQDKGKTLSSVGVEKNLWTVNKNPSAKTLKRVSDDVSHKGSSPGSIDDQILRCGQGMKTRKKGFTSSALLQAGRGNCLNNSEEIFSAVLQFPRKQVVPVEHLTRLILTTTRAQC
jgi:hypothetical protein